MYRIALICFVFCVGTIRPASGQANLEHKLSGGFSLYNNGWGFGAERRTSLQSRSRIAELEFCTFRHSKEVNIVNQNARNPRTYVYGKLNHAGIIRIQGGLEKHLTDFGEKENIHLGASLLAGGGLVLLRPVYLDIYHPGSSSDGLVLPERYNPAVHTNQADILGYSSRKYGWDELTVRPVIQAKGSLNLFWGGITSTEKIFKTGAVFSWFPSGLPLMAITKNPEAGITFFLSFYFSRETQM